MIWAELNECVLLEIDDFFLLLGEEKGKRVFFELYQSICPKTCENFMGLCAGTAKLKYKGSVFHRVVSGGWIQGGDIVNGKGDSGKSIFGETFEDESFAVRFDTPGILAMSSKGPHTNGSQFFVTVAPLPWLDTKAVAFGRVIRGMGSVGKIEAVPCINERPEEPVKVDKCGVVDLASTFDLKF
jgi:peptidyl-prolyl cis-trans isomerase-like 6